MSRIINNMYLVKLTPLALSIVIVFFLFIKDGVAQLSPGDLAKSHSHLEGLSNCTQCHTLGQKVSNDKCLACHTILKNQIDNKVGYHSSKEILGKECITCHSDHHGEKFEMIRFDKEKFDHNLTGYELLGAHTEQKCEDCHKLDFITNEKIKEKKYTYLGLGTDCLSCHTDYHQNTLSSDCIQCHDIDAFKPAYGFNHDKSKFKLLGKHKDVTCVDCHAISNVNGVSFQKFADVEFESCTNCHKDVHNDKFGQNCTKCHTEQSFMEIKSMDNFNHNNTNFKLEDKHQFVDCKECHTTKLTDPVAHNKCTDCHTDYHEKQFVKNNYTPDCSDCHSTKGFSGSSFTIERHNETSFPLEGAHLATPCFVCHMKETKWNFNEIGSKCVNCHDNIHELYIDKKYYPETNCENCHNENTWAEISFDHAKTGYELLGAHSNQSCRACHFTTLPDGELMQKFTGFTSACTDCHVDEHNNQFEKEGVTNCFVCHNNDNWNASKFDHNNTNFPLDGKHIDVACLECHKEKQAAQTTYIQYKLNQYKCENCH